MIDDFPTKTASAQSVRHAINAISIRIALHTERARLPLHWQSLFQLDRNSAFYRRSFVSAGACKTNGDASLYATRVRNPLFLPLLLFILPSFYLVFYLLPSTRLSRVLGAHIHTRKADVYYRACFAISVLPWYQFLFVRYPRASRRNVPGTSGDASPDTCAQEAAFGDIINVIVIPKIKIIILGTVSRAQFERKFSFL